MYLLTLTSTAMVVGRVSVTLTRTDIFILPGLRMGIGRTSRSTNEITALLPITPATRILIASNVYLRFCDMNR